MNSLKIKVANKKPWELTSSATSVAQLRVALVHIISIVGKHFIISSDLVESY